VFEDFTFEIKEGNNSIMTPPIYISQLLDDGRDGNAQASFILEYEYLPDIHAIKLSSGNYTGEYANKVVIGADGEATEIVSKNKFANLNLKKLESPQISKVIYDISTQVIENAKEQGFLVLERNDISPLSDDELKNLMLVYRNGYCLELLDPDTQYESTDEIVPVTSVFGGNVIIIADNTTFYNVIGSTGDPCPNGSWIKFWADNGGNPNCGCIAKNTVGITCNNPLYGGHLVFDHSQMQPVYGSNKVVFIAPLCNAHNNSSNKNEMTAKYTTIGVWLNNYHK